MKKDPLRMTPMMILSRGNYLYHFYYWVYGLIYDIRLTGKSLNRTVFYDAQGAYPVQSISYIYLRELLKEIDYNHCDVFVDVGCAWGRLLGFLRKKTNIKRFIGVELNESAAKCAEKAFRNDKNIQIIFGDILENLPLDGTIYYLFNPFSRDILKQFLDQIEDKINHPLKVMYLHPTCKEEIERRKNWNLVRHSFLKPKHMGALELCIYEFKGLQ